MNPTQLSKLYCLLVSLLALSVLAEIGLPPPKCILQAPGLVPNEPVKFPTPEEAQVIGDACTTDWLVGTPNLCCTEEYRTQVKNSTTAIHQRLFEVLNITAITDPNKSQECKDAIDAISCMPCSGYQDSYFFTYPDGRTEKRVKLCSTFCETLYTYCGEATVTNPATNATVAAKTYFKSGRDVCKAVEGDFGVFGKWEFDVSWDEEYTQCFDPSYLECSAENAMFLYTPCQAGHRDMFWEIESACRGGQRLPAQRHIRRIRCPQNCSAGEYLVPGQEACEACGEGTYSLGGGFQILTWDNKATIVSPTRKVKPIAQIETNAVFETYCINTQTKAVIQNCSWSFNGSFAESNIAGRHYVKSVLEMDVSLARDGQVRFLAKVEGEFNFDRLEFVVDGHEKHWIKNSIEPVEQTFPVPGGYHKLTWEYSKDFSFSRGSDMAQLFMVEVLGTGHADDRCTKCPVGFHANVTSSVECHKCPANTHNPFKGAAKCDPCPSNMYSLPGSGYCDLREPCLQTDAEYYYGSCKPNGLRTKYWRWLEPVICDSRASEHSYVLPGNSEVECAACNPGYHRNSATSHTCSPCPTGQWSPGGNATSCLSCGVGHYAPYTMWLNTWSNFPLGTETHCDGSCGSAGWRLLEDHIDSGSEHGYNVNSVLNIPVNISTEQITGSIEFHWSMDCTSTCFFEFFIDQESKMKVNVLSKETGPKISVFDIPDGNHTLSFVFGKSPANRIVDASKVKITEMIIAGVVKGGAGECLPCPAGTRSNGNTVSCTMCGPGTYSGQGESRCTSCPTDTAHNLEGQGIEGCKECGKGTQTVAGSHECNDNACSFVDGPHKWSFKKLSREDTMYGPIFDSYQPRPFAYYINICSKSHTNSSYCTNYHDHTKTLQTYVCQIVDGGSSGLSMDLGDTIGYKKYVPKDNSTDTGVTIMYTGGFLGCGDEQKNISEVARQTEIHMICDPKAGEGEIKGIKPVHKAGYVWDKVPTDPERCQYQFEWRSVYGCPECSEANMHKVTYPCQSGKYHIISTWNKNPKDCHDGVPLLGTETFPCNKSSLTCKDGQKASVDGAECLDCPANSYTVGNGERYTFRIHQTFPPTFKTSCVNNKGSVNQTCQPWTVHGGLAMSGQHQSSLSIKENFLTPGTITFLYESRLSNPRNKWSFLMDGIEKMEERFSSFGILPSDPIDVPIGTHTFEWRFLRSHKGEESGDDYLGIHEITLRNTTFAPPVCYNCPINEYGSAERDSCEHCPVDHFRTHDMDACEPCPEQYYRLPGMTSCEQMEECDSIRDYVPVYADCVNGKTTLSYRLKASAKNCFGDAAPAPTSDVACPPCPLGQYREGNSGKCKACEGRNSYLDTDSNSCASSGPGQYVEHQMQWLVGHTQELNGISTNCESVTGRCPVGQGFHLSTDPKNNKISDRLETGVSEDEVWMIATIEFAIEDNGPVKGFFEFKHSLIRYDTSSAAISNDTSLDVLVNGVILTDFTLDTSGIEATYAMPLGEGMYNVLFIYHQDAADKNVGVSIRDIYVSGVVADEGSVGVEAYSCPPGYKNDGTSETCSSCPAGTFSAHYKNTECLSCNEGSASLRDGSDACLTCPLGTKSNPEHTDCATTCFFPSFESPVFNLNALSEQVSDEVTILNDEEEPMFIFNLCRKANHTRKNATHQNVYTDLTHLTQVTEDGNLNNLGSYLEFFEKEEKQDEWELHYHSDIAPANCDGGSAIQVLKFICDTTANIGKPIQVDGSDPCHLRFEWRSEFVCRACGKADIRTSYGQCSNDGVQPIVTVRVPGAECVFANATVPLTRKCRVCEKDDFVRELGECLGGIQDVIYRKNKTSTCYDLGYMLGETQACSEVAVNKGVVFGVLIGGGAVLLLLAIGFTYCWRKKHQLAVDYASLNEQYAADDSKL